MTLSERLRQERQARGLSQEQVAAQLDVTRQAVTKWESGAASPSAERLIALASLYGMSLDELAGLQASSREQSKKILHTNLTCIALIAQAASLNTLTIRTYHDLTEGEVLEVRWLTAVKLLVTLLCSVWMAHNLSYERDLPQRRKNTYIELGYCVVQTAVMLLTRRAGRSLLGTAAIIGILMVYIFYVNPTHMRRPLTRRRKRPED